MRTAYTWGESAWQHNFVACAFSNLFLFPLLIIFKKESVASMSPMSAEGTRFYIYVLCLDVVYGIKTGKLFCYMFFVFK